MIDRYHNHQSIAFFWGSYATASKKYRICASSRLIFIECVEGELPRLFQLSIRTSLLYQRLAVSEVPWKRHCMNISPSPQKRFSCSGIMLSSGGKSLSMLCMLYPVNACDTGPVVGTGSAGGLVRRIDGHRLTLTNFSEHLWHKAALNFFSASVGHKSFNEAIYPWFPTLSAKL